MNDTYLKELNFTLFYTASILETCERKGGLKSFRSEKETKKSQILKMRKDKGILKEWQTAFPPPQKACQIPSNFIFHKHLAQQKHDLPIKKSNFVCACVFGVGGWR